MIADAQNRLALHEEALAWNAYRHHCLRSMYGNRGYACKEFLGDATSHELWRTWSAAYERRCILRRTR